MNESNSTSSNNNTTSTSTKEFKIGTESLAVIFIFFVLLLGGIIRIFSKKYKVAFTPLIFLLGLAISLFSSGTGIFKESFSRITQIDPHGLLQINLPILLFNGAFNLDWHIFRREIKQITFLGTFGAIFNACLMLLAIKFFLYVDDDKYSWLSAFMFGALISCTDPIAIINVLRELPSTKKFNVLLEGESLINATTGMILYQIASTFYKASGHGLWFVIYTFISLSVAGIILGILSGFLCSYMIQKLFNDEILVANTTLMSSYIVYFIAEGSNLLGFQISGIMAVISCGLFMSAVGKSKINSHSDYAVYAFWNFLVFASESIIFFLAGIFLGENVWNVEGYIGSIDYYKLIILFIFLNITRFIMLIISYPLIKRHGYGLTFDELKCLLFGGLKGGISISFALLVMRDESLSAPLRDILFFDIAGCAFLTLIINSPIFGYLIHKMKILQINKTKNHVFKNFLEALLGDLDNKMEELKNNQYLQVADWEQVKELSGLFDIHHDIFDLDKQTRTSIKSILIKKDKNEKNEIEMNLLDQSKESIDFENQPNIAEKEIPLLVECRNRIIMSLKGFYYELFKQNQCSGDSFLKLIESADWDLDNESSAMTSWTVINNSFYKPGYVKAIMELQNVHCIGSIVKQVVFNHVAHAYDITSCYVEAHRNAEALAKKMPMNEKYIKIILAEIEENRKKAEEYIYSYLEVSFPEITRSIQTKRAAYNILQYERSILDKKHLMGQIDEKEYSFIINKIDNKMIKLGSYNPEWIRVPLKKLMQNIPFFAYIPQQTIDKLVAASEEKIFEKDAPIISQGEKATKFFIITRGGGTEIAHSEKSMYREKKGVGSVISFHQLVSKSSTYETTFLSDSIVNVAALPLDAMKELISRNTDHEAFAWRESIYSLSRLHRSELRPLDLLERMDLIKLWSHTAFRKYEIGDTLNLQKGGILLQGALKVYDKEVYGDLVNELNNSIQNLNISDSLSKKEKENEKKRINKTFLDEINKLEKFIIYENFHFFEPLNNDIDFVVVKPVTIFEFIDVDEVRNIFNKDQKENYSKYMVKKMEVVKKDQNVKLDSDEEIKKEDE